MSPILRPNSIPKVAMHISALVWMEFVTAIKWLDVSTRKKYKEKGTRKKAPFPLSKSMFHSLNKKKKKINVSCVSILNALCSLLEIWTLCCLFIYFFGRIFGPCVGWASIKHFNSTRPALDAERSYSLRAIWFLIHLMHYFYFPFAISLPPSGGPQKSFFWGVICKIYVKF